MKNGLLTTKTVSLRSLLSNGVQFTVPRYQREYSWTQEHWEDLWEDLMEVEKTGRPHYMGAIVLTDRGQEDFLIIDGQQRLATLSLLVIAALRCLKEWDEREGINANKPRIDLLTSAFLGMQHPATLRTSPKIRLNDANRSFFEGILLPLDDPVSISALRQAEKSTWEAMLFFQRKLEEWSGGVRDGETLASFIYDTVSTSLLFIQVIVEDEAGAYTVFETLNARGLELTAADLLKNYLMSVVHETGEGSLDAASTIWSEISGRVEARRIPEFLRHYLNSKSSYVRLEKVYKKIRSEVKSATQAFAFLRELDRASILIEALDDPTSSFWHDLPDGRKAARNLHLYGVKQYRPVALAALRQLPPDHFEKVLRALHILSFRYTVIGQKNTNQLEYVFNRVAVGIESQELKTWQQVQAALALDAYPNDDEFREAFTLCSFPVPGQRTKLVRHILLELQRQLYGGDQDWESSSATIEHVLPKNPTEEWSQEFPEDVQSRYVDRLGNMVLLEPKLNHKEAANEPIAKKAKIYAASSYPLTSKGDYDIWTPKFIEERQAKLAKTATAIWRLPTISQ